MTNGPREADGAFAIVPSGPGSLQIVLEPVSRTEKEPLAHGKLQPLGTHNLESPPAHMVRMDILNGILDDIEMRKWLQ